MRSMSVSSQRAYFDAICHVMCQNPRSEQDDHDIEAIVDVLRENQ